MSVRTLLLVFFFAAGNEHEQKWRQIYLTISDQYICFARKLLVMFGKNSFMFQGTLAIITTNGLLSERFVAVTPALKKKKNLLS